MDLNPKQARFVEEYLIDLNATQAGIRAGYSQDSAYSQAHELLKKPEIAEAIQKAQKARSERTQVSQDEIINELKGLAFSRLKDFAEWDEGGIRYKPSEEIENDAGIEAIEDYRVIKSSSSGEDQVLTSNITLKRAKDKIKALELLGKHLGMFKETVQLQGNLGTPVEITFKAPDDPG